MDDVAPLLLPRLPLPVLEEDPGPVEWSELLPPIDPWLESWVDPLMPLPEVLPELPL